MEKIGELKWKEERVDYPTVTTAGESGSAESAGAAIGLALLKVARERLKRDKADPVRRLLRDMEGKAGDPFRPEEGEAHPDHPFFRYYGQLMHQSNMLNDAVRTGTYHQACVTNPVDFRDKVVVDVGTGTGILAFFAVKAGARKVYAIEASGMAEHARRLMAANGLSDRVEVVHGKVEEVELPEKADLIISEPMGFILVHERMLESYMIARERFLAPGGKMFPTTGTMFFAPFSDQALWEEQNERADFWKERNFWGLDLTCLLEPAREDHFSQPVVGYFPPSILLCAATAQHTIDFSSHSPESLHHIVIPFRFVIQKTAVMHGIAGWFDVDFKGTSKTVTLSTGPYSTGTHWYQCRFLFKEPLGVNATQVVSGEIDMVANDQYSYNVTVRCSLDGTHIATTAAINLQDQYYHYLHNEDSATDAGATIDSTLPPTAPDPAAVYAASLAAATSSSSTAPPPATSAASAAAASGGGGEGGGGEEIPEGFIEA